MRTHDNTSRILIAGGCHVTGYPVGAEHSFVSVLRTRLARLGFQVDVDLVSHLGLGHPEKVVERCIAAKPDILVLQLGGWESTQLRKLTSRLVAMKVNAWAVRFIWHWFDLPSDLRRVANSPSPELPGDCRNVNTGASVRASTVGERILSFTVGRPLAELDRASISARFFFSVVRALQIPEVIVLGPFPTLNPIVMYYRLRLALILEQCAHSAGFHFCDVIHGPLSDGQSSTTGARLFVDNLHLSAEGHRVLGEWMAPFVAGIRRSQFEVSV